MPDPARSGCPDRLLGVLRCGVPARRIITLTTDFGLTDAYVAVMKGVILEIAPDSVIVDVSHEVPPQQVAGGAFLLRSAYRYFPADTVHVGVVDPGVGTTRRPVAIRSAHGLFVGPDNGLFSLALADQDVLDMATGSLHGAEAVELAETTYRREPVSQTFHGRDIFAPAAAHLANGVSLAQLGSPVSSLQVARSELPHHSDEQVRGSILHIDHFGNAISNIDAGLLPAAPIFEIAGHAIRGVATSYQEAPIVAIVGSTGLIEIAAGNGSAARTLGIRVGDPIVMRGVP